MKRKIIRPKGKNYAQQLQEEKSIRQSKATWDGFNLATMMMVVAINNVYGSAKSGSRSSRTK